MCCEVTAACKCGWEGKGKHGPGAFKKHQLTCDAGKKDLPPKAD